MIKVNNHIGCIELSADYLQKLIAKTAAGCFGVAGLSGCATGLRSVIPNISGDSAADNGVMIRQSGNKLTVDLHITVSYGVNITAIVDSIINKVHFTLEQEAGIEVDKINVYVDAMQS